jgi:hypothetical protein
LKNAVGEENDEDVSQFDVLAASETEEFTLAEIRIKAADLAQHVIISDLVISSFVYLFLEFRYEVYNKHVHHFLRKSYLSEKSGFSPFLSLAFVQASARVLFMLSSPSSYIFFIIFMMEALGSSGFDSSFSGLAEN